ncbi:MAG: drug/metabolite transporter (DMT)-like permease [Planctomycetota bacterium]|jgi:drug/metabolite transporter (DMT)-like permease
MKLASPYYAGIIFAAVAALGLGAITTQAKIVYSDGSNALTLMLMRFLLSTLVFGALLMFGKTGFRVEKSRRIDLLLIGLIWSVAMICYLSSVETISVSLAVLILYAYPLLVLCFSIVNRLLPLSMPLVLLFLAAFSGLYLALSGATMSVNLNGIMFAALASLGATYTFIRGAVVAPKMSPLVMTFWINLIGLFVILPLMPGKLLLPENSVAIIALSAATLFYVIAILCQFEALARLPAAMAAFVLNLEPVISILLAMLVLNEILSTIQWVGVVMVVSAVLLSIRFKPESVDRG